MTSSVCPQQGYSSIVDSTVRPPPRPGAWWSDSADPDGSDPAGDPPPTTALEFPLPRSICCEPECLGGVWRHCFGCRQCLCREHSQTGCPNCLIVPLCSVCNLRHLCHIPQSLTAGEEEDNPLDNEEPPGENDDFLAQVAATQGPAVLCSPPSITSAETDQGEAGQDDPSRRTPAPIFFNGVMPFPEHLAPPPPRQTVGPNPGPNRPEHSGSAAASKNTTPALKPRWICVPKPTSSQLTGATSSAQPAAEPESDADEDLIALATEYNQILQGLQDDEGIDMVQEQLLATGVPPSHQLDLSIQRVRIRDFIEGHGSIGDLQPSDFEMCPDILNRRLIWTQGRSMYGPCRHCGARTHEHFRCRYRFHCRFCGDSQHSDGLCHVPCPHCGLTARHRPEGCPYRPRPPQAAPKPSQPPGSQVSVSTQTLPGTQSKAMGYLAIAKAAAGKAATEK